MCIPAPQFSRTVSRALYRSHTLRACVVCCVVPLCHISSVAITSRTMTTRRRRSRPLSAAQHTFTSPHLCAQGGGDFDSAAESEDGAAAAAGRPENGKKGGKKAAVKAVTARQQADLELLAMDDAALLAADAPAHKAAGDADGAPRAVSCCFRSCTAAARRGCTSPVHRSS